MLINQHTTIRGRDVILVPYRKEHVEKYHKWMQSEELQRLTASQPLTLEEEYQMQQSWLHDENKCTFIVLDKHLYDKNHDEVGAMIGDTNLFFANNEDKMVAEAEIMIAELSSRGCHRGWQAMLLMLLYAIEDIGVKQFVVKISLDNIISIKMFEKMGFVQTEQSAVFKEVTLNKIVTDHWIEQIKKTLGNYQIIKKTEL